jgi:hypothetical protein
VARPSETEPAGARPGAAQPRAERGERDGWSSVLLVPVWIGSFIGIWAGLDALFVRVATAMIGTPLSAGANALASAREVVSPVLALLLGSYAIALLGALQRRIRGEPSPCRAPDGERPPRSGVTRAMRDASAIAQVERELGRARRAERSGPRRAALAVNDRLMVAALRRRGYDDIGCGGIVAILLAATAALPFVAEAAGRLAGFELAGPLAALLWFALAYGGFALRGVWKWSRERAGGRT